MEAAVNAVQNYFKEDDENRAVFQLLVERKNEEDAGTTGCQYMGYGVLLAAAIDSAFSSCEPFRNSIILALSRRNQLLGMLLAKMLNPNEEEE